MTKHTTADIGFAIASYLEGKLVNHYEADEHGDLNEIADAVTIVDYVDASDSDNLIVVLKNGQKFTIRIAAF